MKNVGVIVFTVLAVFAATSFGISQTWGRIGSKDKIIFSQRVFNYTSYYGITRKVQFPEYKKNNKLTITAMQAIDNSRNTTNSHPTLIAGGPGYKYMTMNIQCGGKSNLDYQVVIYGK
ncbi:uncharacterized protein LOC129916040 [Episyrphus balteatus]|uniref:uncharacterized protein LOC129916040 n=1 Tax=Episyrphus balteatus TaxID=286459 RepID=UPI00248506EB|nr:uncharacterized protein LOC129916040 [Episyrphus balteatus]